MALEPKLAGGEASAFTSCYSWELLPGLCFSMISGILSTTTFERSSSCRKIADVGRSTLKKANGDALVYISRNSTHRKYRPAETSSELMQGLMRMDKHRKFKWIVHWSHSVQQGISRRPRHLTSFLLTGSSIWITWLANTVADRDWTVVSSETRQISSEAGYRHFIPDEQHGTLTTFKDCGCDR